MNRTITPAADVLASDGAWLLHLDLPGVRQEQLDVQVDRGQLTIQSRQGDDAPPRHWRRLTLPQDADADRIEATLADGVLSVTIPRSTQAPRQVPIA